MALVGAKNPAQVEEQLGAIGVVFTDEELTLIDQYSGRRSPSSISALGERRVRLSRCVCLCTVDSGKQHAGMTSWRSVCLDVDSG